jgi:phage gp36-like protein
MAYCTYDQVEEEFKALTLSASTSVTITQAQRFITEADAEIDSIIGVRYDTPVTDATGLIILRKISIELVASRIQKILATKTSVESAKQSGREEDLEAKAMKKLEKIADGSMKLGSATLVTSHQGIRVTT